MVKHMTRSLIVAGVLAAGLAGAPHANQRDDSALRDRATAKPSTTAAAHPTSPNTTSKGVIVDPRRHVHAPVLPLTRTDR